MDLKPQDIHVSILLLDHARVNSRQTPKHTDYVFDIDIGDMVLIEEQQHVMDIIVQNPQTLHILLGSPGSCKTYIVQYFRISNEMVVFLATTEATTLTLSRSASIVHIVFRIPTHGYLFVLLEPTLF